MLAQAVYPQTWEHGGAVRHRLSWLDRSILGVSTGVDFRVDRPSLLRSAGFGPTGHATPQADSRHPRRQGRRGRLRQRRLLLAGVPADEVAGPVAGRRRGALRRQGGPLDPHRRRVGAHLGGLLGGGRLLWKAPGGLLHESLQADFLFPPPLSSLSPARLLLLFALSPARLSSLFLLFRSSSPCLSLSLLCFVCLFVCLSPSLFALFVSQPLCSAPPGPIARSATAVARGNALTERSCLYRRLYTPMLCPALQAGDP